MWNCLSKSDNKPFALHAPPLILVHLKEIANGIQKNHVKYFVTVIHWNYGYESLTQSISCNLINIYDRFPAQSFEL